MNILQSKRTPNTTAHTTSIVGMTSANASVKFVLTGVIYDVSSPNAFDRVLDNVFAVNLSPT